MHNVKYTVTLTNTEDNAKAHINTIEEKLHNATHTSTEDNTNIQNDTRNTQALKAPKYILFTNTCTYTVELPIFEHWRPEVKIAKKAKVKNLQDYETFMEVKDKGQTKVGSGWVITKKEQHDGQKTKVKARLVA